MRGLISVAMLSELEKLTGKPVQQLFDMVAGTSTGAIIAAGIAVGMTADQLLNDIYLKALPEGFRSQPQGIQFWIRYILGGLRHLYELEPFTKVLAPIVKGVTIGNLHDQDTPGSKRPIVFMTTHDVRTNNTYYVVSKGPGRAQFVDWPLSGAVTASGAAPVFFPPVLGNLIDGGVGAYGNPCLVASVEAMEYIGSAEGFVDNEVIHFSFGTGSVPSAYQNGAAGRFWLKNWLEYAIATGLDESALQQVIITRTLYQNRLDFRRYNPLLTSASVRDVLGVSLDGRPDPATLGLDSYAPEALALMEDIGRSYAHKIDWTQPGYLPWVSDKTSPDYGQAHDGGRPLPGTLPADWRGTIYE
ncbi:MAG: patatin-like phospholipase family protein [Anaerolineaceae bacterium]|nr:patatin-like phospholipase family protein [Anaerolineaceae bacterium]